MILEPDRFDAITALRPGSEWYSTADGVLHWVSEDTTAPTGFKYREYPDVHGRIGAFVR